MCAACSRKRSVAKYDHSEKGIAARKRHTQGAAFKATQKRYLKSEKGKAKQLRYAQTEKGKAVFARKNSKRYWADPEYYRKRALERLHGIESYELDNKCAWCGTVENLSLDHGHPQVRGGTGDLSNLHTLCVPCNSFKRDRLITEGPNPGLLIR